jgi:DNA-binding response OmpR family regulator
VRADSDVPIIMLTARDGEEELLRGLEVGADDYITKPFSPRELVARLRALLRRAQGKSEPQADVLERAGGRLVVEPARRRATLDGRTIKLTESEYALLVALARFPGRVYTRFELINKVQGYDFEGYERTIDAHVKNLRRKLGDDPRQPGLIETVYGRGYRFVEEPA